MINIIVCIKLVNDPEAPPSSFQIDATNNAVLLPPGVSQVISTFDEFALEAALQTREKEGGKITALSLGSNIQRDIIKKPLSMGADELVLLDDPAFTDGDSWSTAYALALAIKKIERFDLILCGRQAADWDSGQVGSGIAELLGLPCVNISRKIEISGAKAIIERVINDGYETIEMDLPGVITVSNEHPTPRYPNINGIMKAKGKEPLVWKPSDIGADMAKIGANGRRSKLIRLFQQPRNTKCEIITGDTPENAAVKLADRLREAKVI